jgi:transposase-like protein
MNLQNLAQNFSSEDQARRFFEKQRWPDGVVCPHCGVVGESYRLEGDPESKTPVRKGVWKCRGCQKQFTCTVGTIFADSHIPLNKWLMAIHFLCASKKGMSSHQLHRMLGVTYKSAWFMTHRIRHAMAQESLLSPLSGTVEVDETYVGGKEKGNPGHPTPERSKKVPVVSMVERSLVNKTGRVHSRAVERVDVKTLKPILKECIAEGTTVNTDEATVYYYCNDDFPKKAGVESPLTLWKDTSQL